MHRNGDNLKSISDKDTLLCAYEHEVHGNEAVCKAGFGVVILMRDLVDTFSPGMCEGDSVIGAMCGRVCTDLNHPSFIGVDGLSNNSAEISGFSHVLKFMKEHLKVLGDFGRVCVMYDSMYACCSTLGPWNSHHHAAAAENIRNHAVHILSYIRLQCVHVKARSGHFYNDWADSLARKGSSLQDDSLILEPWHLDKLYGFTHADTPISQNNNNRSNRCSNDVCSMYADCSKHDSSVYYLSIWGLDLHVLL